MYTIFRNIQMWRYYSIQGVLARGGGNAVCVYHLGSVVPFQGQPVPGARISHWEFYHLGLWI